MQSKLSFTLKLFLFVFIVFLPTCIYSQWKKGDWLVEGAIGNLRYNSEKLNKQIDHYPDKYSSVSFNFYSSLGFFLTQNIMLGANLNFTFSHLKSEVFYSPYYKTPSEKQSNQVSTLGLYPAIRYYLPTKGMKNKLYFQFDCGTGFFLVQKNEYERYNANGGQISKTTSNYSKKTTGLNWNAFIGFNHFLTSNVAFNSTLGFNYNKFSSPLNSTTVDVTGIYNQTSTYTSYRNNLFWTLGFTIILPGKNNK